MRVVPLAFSQVNWQEFMTLANDVVGRHPTRSLDSASIPTGDPFSFIAALEELRLPGRQPKQAVIDSSDLLQHVTASFIVHVDDHDFHILQNIPILKISSIEGKDQRRGEPDQLLVITGNLLEWQTVLPNMISRSATQELFSKIYVLFKRMNLRELFDNYREVTTSNGLFSLELK